MLIVAYAPTAAAQEPPKNLTPEAEGRDGPGQGEADAPAPTGLSVTSSTDTNVSLIWNSVSNSYRYKLERRAGRFGSWSTVSQYISGTSRTVYSLTCDTTYYFRVSARGDGSPYSTTLGSASSSVSRATSACPPTIGVDVQNPFVGQAVTMTVSTTGSSGTVSSYQWQEWSGGSWTDLGATTTSAIRSESSSVSGYRIFRVVVAYTSGTPVESYAITIEWKAMTVSVTSSPEFPRSGPAATSTVTLTAGGDVPSGAVYQWQQATSSDWTDLGATTTSPTKEVWSATRGTRKYRVVVSHLGVTAESEPVYVTWDEWAIVAEMIGELSAAVATSTDYTNAQTSLLSCMNATSTTSTGSGPKSPSDSRAPTMPPAVTFATFDDVLASYTGDVKARMDAGGDCAATSTTMFSTNESVTRAELARLKAGNSWLRESERSSWITSPEQKVSRPGPTTHTVFTLRSETAYRFKIRFRGDGARYVGDVEGVPRHGPWSPEVTATTQATTATGTISIADLSSKTPQVGRQVSFWVGASGLTASTRYRIKLTVQSGDFGFNGDYSDKVELIRNLNPGLGTSLRRQVRIRACSASTATVIARLIHDPINGNRSTLHSHEVTVTTAAPATPAPPVLSAGAEAAFVGETVTLTASAQSPGSVAHYQWQQWGAGSWTDLGATTPIATRGVTSNAAAVNFYRVLVVYDFGTTLESQPVAVEWKAVSVGVSSSPDYPQSGPAATSTVTLTAGGDVPSGAEYQWQHTTSSGWTDLGATTTSATKEVTSARRGTRKFRVEVSHAEMTVQSEPVYVTWDEWDIVAGMVGELSAGVASSSDYLRDQTALMGCMRATSTSPGSGGGRSVPRPPLAATIVTFDDLLASYTGDVKAKMEDTGSDGCATESKASLNKPLL